VLYCNIDTKFSLAVGDLHPSKDFIYEIFSSTYQRDALQYYSSINLLKNDNIKITESFKSSKKDSSLVLAK